MTYAINHNYGSAYASSEVSSKFRSHIPRYNFGSPPPPQFNNFVLPQRQFGIVGQGNLFSPPPLISYGSSNTSFNLGHQAFNKSVGVLASAVIGAIYSTPMSGGNFPGSLSSSGNSFEYSSWSPPSHGNVWSQKSLTPPFIHSQSTQHVNNYNRMSMGW